MSTMKQRHDIYQSALKRILIAGDSVENKNCPWCGWRHVHNLGCPMDVARKALAMGLWPALGIKQEAKKEDSR